MASCWPTRRCWGANAGRQWRGLYAGFRERGRAASPLVGACVAGLGAQAGHVPCGFPSRRGQVSAVRSFFDFPGAHMEGETLDWQGALLLIANFPGDAWACGLFWIKFQATGDSGHMFIRYKFTTIYSFEF